MKADACLVDIKISIQGKFLVALITPDPVLAVYPPKLRPWREWLPVRIDPQELKF